MPKLMCPVDGCDCQSQDLDAAFAEALTTPLKMLDKTAHKATPASKYTGKCKEPNCTNTFDYSNEIIKDNLIRGIADPEILSDLLNDLKTDRTLEETATFIAQKEQGKATKTAVGDCFGAMSHLPISKTYHPPKLKPQATPGRKWWACGGPRHDQKNDRATRSRSCEAWSHTCAKFSVKEG
ncbi:hypothetical protein RRG08_004429 [Elysia crispata]|uniref:Uncharacterized protein n=1 Tax=Elysia crispata TaxID=231223 RepID=A0AAE1DWZ6_9GAST|nr:hypothetical protein RRG08_004429 [Elysia crispata]